MENSITKINGVHKISLKGNFLTEQQGEAILDEIDQLIENNNNLFIVDLAELKFINSSGLSFLLRILTKARRSSGEAILTNLPDQLPNLLIITKLNAVFITADNNDDAIAQLSKSS